MEVLFSSRKADWAESPDQHEERAAEHRGGQRPEREDDLPGRRTGDPWRHLAHEQPADHDGQHTGGVDDVGQQERSERGHQHRDGLEHRVVHPAAHLPADQPDQRAGEHASDVRQHQQPGHVPAGELLLADRHAHGQPVEDQGGAVVDQALGAEHGHRAARQVAGQDADRRRVGGRQRGAEDPRRPPLEAEPVRSGGDRGGGGEHQRGAGQHHDPQVVADLPQRGRQALPVQQRGQEHEEHDLRRQLGLPQVRHEPDQHPDQHEQDGRRDRVAARERAARDQGDPEHDDHFESKHGLILTSLMPVDHLGTGRWNDDPVGEATATGTAVVRLPRSSSSQNPELDLRGGAGWRRRTRARGSRRRRPRRRPAGRGPARDRLDEEQVRGLRVVPAGDEAVDDDRRVLRADDPLGPSAGRSHGGAAATGRPPTRGRG